MNKETQNANGHISILIQRFDEKIDEIYYTKIYILDEKQNSETYKYDLKVYKKLEKELKEILLKMVDLNTRVLNLAFTEQIANRFERYIYIVNL